MTELPPLPEPAVNNWETAPIEDLRAEVKALRLWSANLFMEVKGWRNRMNELAAASEQILKLRSDDESKYIALSNKLAEIEHGMDIHHDFINAHTLLLNKQEELDENITLIMDFLGMSGDEPAPDDTPQPPY